MSVLGLLTVLLALCAFLWPAAIYLPVDRTGWRLLGGSARDNAAPIPIPVDHSATPRSRGEVIPPAPMGATVAVHSPTGLGHFALPAFCLLHHARVGRRPKLSSS
jgi:hypothetical protein